MARMVWALFCEHHSTDNKGRNTYTSVFDNMSIRIRAQGGQPVPTEPLPFAIPSSPFVLAVHVTGAPEGHQCALRVKGPDGLRIGPELSGRLTANPNGRYNWHVGFTNGIPVMKSGLYSFEIMLDEEKLGEAELPISLDLG